MPDPDRIRKAFVDQHAYYASDRGIRNLQARGAEAVVTQQYAGRVPFELLQNALDRCAGAVRILRTSDSLIVANDGRPITVTPSLDHYNPPANSTELSDFHALCSLHTSNKSPDENTGNKGVGFKSVFSLSRHVRVWTKLHGEEGWWGIGLREGTTPVTWNQDCRSSEAQAGLSRFLKHSSYPGEDDRERPSYHFPVPLWSASLPEGLEPSLRDMATAVVVPLGSKRAFRRADSALEALVPHHFHFLGLRRTSGPVEVVMTRKGKPDHHWSIHLAEDGPALTSWRSANRSLLRQAREAGLRLNRGVICSVRWPDHPVPGGAREDRAPTVYCFLPTETPSAFGADIHADFQLGIDRKSLDLKENESAGAYNLELLERLSHLHLIFAIRHLGLNPASFGPWPGVKPRSCELPARRPAFRHDIWDFLDPGPSLANVPKSEQPLRRTLVAHMYASIFGDHNLEHRDAWTRWAQLARACFDGTPRPTETYRGFWRATVNWLNTKWPTSHHAGPHRAAKACLEELRAVGAQVVPITTTDGKNGAAEKADVIGLVPPEVPAEGSVPSGRRSAARLFQRTGDEGSHVATLDVPVAVQDRGRQVTAWSFHWYFNNNQQILVGSARFDRVTLLRELRQLPHTTTPQELATRPRLDRVRQRQLVSYAAALFTLPVVRNQEDLTWSNQHWSPGWRAVKARSNRPQAGAGRAVATLFLQCKDGKWRPARQCHEQHLDPGFLDEVVEDVPALGEETVLRRFLTFLGVCTWPGGLLLVEDGDAGIVPPQGEPPDLIEAPRGAIPALQIPFRVPGAFGDMPSGFGDVEIDAEAVRDAVRQAWDDGWIRALLNTSDDDSSRALDVIESLSRTPWFPVSGDGARPPEGVPGPHPPGIKPASLALVARGDPRITMALWRVTATGDERGMLEFFGARDLEGLCSDPPRTVGTIRALARRFPDPSRLSAQPQVALGLEEFFNRAINALADHTQADPAVWPRTLPLLARLPPDHPTGDTSGGTTSDAPPPDLAMTRLAWCPAEQIRVAEDNATMTLVQRLFRSRYTLLAATVAARKLRNTPLEGRTINLKYDLKSKGTRYEGDRGHVWQEFDGLLARLLALAFTSPRRSGVLDPVDARTRWHNTRFVRATDVWRAWYVHGDPGAGVAEPEKNQFDDVLVDTERKDKRVVGSKIYFDVPPDASPALRPVHRPPLTYFASALAEAVLDRTIEADWRAALSEADADGPGNVPGPRLRAFLERHHVDQALVNYYQQSLRPLHAGQRQIHRDKVVAALASVVLDLADSSWDLRAGTLLRTEDVTGVTAAHTEAQVVVALATIDWAEHEVPFRVTFSCSNDNEQRWNTWLDTDQRRVRMLRYAYDRQADECPRDDELLRSAMADDLQSAGARAASHLHFDPEATARAWLDDTPTDPLDDWLPRIRDFRAIEGGIQFVPLGVVPLIHDRPTEGEFGAHDAAKEALKNTAKAAKGRGAEEVLLDLVAATTQTIVDGHGDEAWIALRSVMHPHKSMWTLVDRAWRTGNPELKDLLHVSRRWNSAGFDVLGLEYDPDGAPQPIRYEVKALPASEGQVQIFVSLNELNVHRAVCDRTYPWSQRGRWFLVGVTHTGTALDLTRSLAPVIAPNAPELAGLARVGMLPDGLRVVVRVGGP
jgi:hypothetical protein